jgi:uncharacterized protein YyaL (SSP411 family)
MNSEDSLEQRLRQAEAAREGSYDKRTEHLDEQGRALFINRLILEDSPYLLQHAHNPVNWYPWSEEAFETALAEDKPIFLSIGYSTCHWCHVMEVESFDNVEVARLLNKHFICIKMDREQYPDLDEIYMAGVQLMSGQGGWPMSSFLFADGKPFFGATYFPPPTFMDLLNRIVDAWQGQRQDLLNSAESLDRAIKRLLGIRTEKTQLNESVHQATVQALLEREDKTLGGLAGAPKFPQEPLLLFMLDQAARHEDSESLAFVCRALDGMAQGGIYDQVAGGFHRYSVDAQWLVPHFEKMLYNQSQLALVYLRAWQLTGDDFYQRVLRQTLNYVLRDMEAPQGGFYSATDADSEGAEGLFFIWTPAELAAAVSEDDYKLLEFVFDISERGNFEGANILRQRERLDRLAEQWGKDFYSRLDTVLASLYKVREGREHPLRDDKRIVAWNGDMINSLALAALQTGEQSWLQAAESAADSIIVNNVQADGSLLRINLDGDCSIVGQLEDYAHFVSALLSLFDATGKSDYLQHAARLADYVLINFYDEQAQTLYLSPAKCEGPMLVRSVNAGDGATLSPVAGMLMNLLALEQRCAFLGDNFEVRGRRYQAVAEQLLAGLAAMVNEQPLGHSSMLRAYSQSQQGQYFGLAWAGQGRARLAVTRDRQQSTADTMQLSLQVTLMPGWHLNADAGSSMAGLQSLAIDLVGDTWQLESVQMPTATALDLGEMGKVQALSGSFELPLNLQRRAEAEGQVGFVCLQVQLQLCEQGRCLLPQTLHVLV